MIYTVTFNPAIDYIMKLDELQSKDINRSNGEELAYGGKGINVSYILSQLGVKSKALGFLAGFSGEQLEKMMCEDDIDNDFVHLKSGYTRINVKIKADKEYDINAQGPDVSNEEIEALTKKINALQDGDILVLAGSIPSSLPNDIYEKILEENSKKDVKFVVDATGDLLVNVLKYKPFMIKPNHHELGEIFGVEIETLEDVEKYAKRLQDMGAKNVLVSMGKNGAALLDETGAIYTMGNAPGKIKSSVGCGDSTVAGFIAGYLKKQDYKYALWLGSVCGNATAFSYTLANKQEIEKMMQNEYLK